MTIVRDVMTVHPRSVRDNQTLTEAAQMMRDLDVDALPVCGQDGRLRGMLSDRDIISCVAERHNPGIARAGESCNAEPVTISPDDDIREALEEMRAAQLEQLPVIDGYGLVGVIRLSAAETNEAVTTVAK